MTLDDSALLHGGAYDPIKAREYYLRTRHLKGRRTKGVVPTPQPKPSAPVKAGAHRSGEARRNELEAQRAALEKRLDRLREVLRDLVNAAKARSGVDPKDSDDPKETASKNESNKKDVPLTAKQKRDKATKARDRYEKEHGSPSQDVEQLQKQIRDIRAKIEKALQDARQKSTKTNTQTAVKGR